jgi:hypothetical protein
MSVKVIQYSFKVALEGNQYPLVKDFLDENISSLSIFCPIVSSSCRAR